MSRGRRYWYTGLKGCWRCGCCRCVCVCFSLTLDTISSATCRGSCSCFMIASPNREAGHVAQVLPIPVKLRPYTIVQQQKDSALDRPYDVFCCSHKVLIYCLTTTYHEVALRKVFTDKTEFYTALHFWSPGKQLQSFTLNSEAKDDQHARNGARFECMIVGSL